MSRRIHRWIAVVPALTLSCFAACGGDGGGDDVGGQDAGTDTGTDAGGQDGNGPDGGGDDSGVDGGSGGTPGETRLDCNDYPASLQGDILEAVAHGNITKAEGGADVWLDATLEFLKKESSKFDEDLIALFQLNAEGSPGDDSLTSISWDVNHDAILLGTSLGVNAPLFVANSVVGGGAPGTAAPLGVIGRISETPYMVFASNPFRATTNAQLDQFLDNAVRRLTGAKDGDALNVTLAHATQGQYFPDEVGTRAWFTTRFGASATLNADGACDDAALAGCLENTDLLIISQEAAESSDVDAIRDRVEDALADGIPVIYFGYDGEATPLGTELLGLLQVKNGGDNYWTKYTVSNFDPSTLVGGKNPEYLTYITMIERLKSGQYDFTLANARSSALATYNAQFATAASATRSMMTALDGAGVNIFAECGNYFPKMLALLGDSLRQEITYPMTVASTPTGQFLRAYFADHALLNARSFAPAQPNRGDFDTKDLSQVTPVKRTVKLTSRPNFRSTGAYALPGQVMRVTRRDEGDVTVRVFVNPQRDGSTHEWEDSVYGGYSRPKFLQTQSVPLPPGKTVSFTSVYGGPVQLGFDKTGVEVEVDFENVGEHPHWASTADDERFAQALQAATYDWVEVETEAFEIHSRLDLFQRTMEFDPTWDTPAKLTAIIEKYTFNYSHVAAGFAGNGVDAVPEIVDWASSKGFDMPVVDLVKHANLDKPTCGSGCSGNPYDAAWAFAPISYGDVHELGHGLQIPRFELVYGGRQHDNHSVTNWYLAYMGNRYYDDGKGEAQVWPIDNRALFTQIQAAYAAGERSGTFSTRVRDYVAGVLANGETVPGKSLNYSFYSQVMMMAKSKGKLTDGYHMIPRIHVIDRAFRAALATDASWNAARSGLGFSGFTFDEAKALGNNDFMAIAICLATGLDYRDYFDMFGLEVGAKAKSQIQGFGYPTVERAYFAIGDVDHMRGAFTSRAGQMQKITINGTTGWPL